MINTMKSLLALCLFYSAASVSTAETPIKHTSFRPGEIWTDNNGAHINAHGGGILYDKGTYYWYTAIPPKTSITRRTKESP